MRLLLTVMIAACLSGECLAQTRQTCLLSGRRRSDAELQQIRALLQQIQAEQRIQSVLLQDLANARGQQQPTPVVVQPRIVIPNPQDVPAVRIPNPADVPAARIPNPADVPASRIPNPADVPAAVIPNPQDIPAAPAPPPVPLDQMQGGGSGTQLPTIPQLPTARQNPWPDRYTAMRERTQWRPVGQTRTARIRSALR